MEPRFDTLDDGNGLEIEDRIENRQFAVYTPEEVSPTPADTGEFAFPVSSACAISTERIELPYAIVTVVRDAATGAQLANAEPPCVRDLEAGEYLLELLSTPIKLYLRVDSPLRIDADDDGTRLEFGDPTRVGVGARSFHTSPAETVVVPDDPAAVLRGVSTFGSALKTTTCERSWPTLRGHPPRLRRGDELSIPEGLEPPDSGVTLRVPPEYEFAFPIAPLAYYLGAAVVPGDAPVLTTDTGFSYALDGPGGFEDEVARVMKRLLLFDAAVRTEGYFRSPLHERRVLESNPAVDLDFASLYDAPLAEQLETYLSIPFSAVADAVPTWDRVVYTRPSATGVESLPSVVEDLSLVRVRSPERSVATDRSGGDDSGGDDRAETGDRPESGDQSGQSESVASFKRTGGPDDDPRGIPGRGEYVPLPETDALERAWVGDGAPVHGSKLLPGAVDRAGEASADGTITVTVVCNDEAMREEWDSVAGLYGDREVVRFDTDCRFGVSTDQLRDLLAEETDLFHFVGHIDGRGFECPDGVLDATALDDVGATTVLLNACRSYEQGVGLVDAGARASIVTVADVGNEGAVEVGETLARLLNYGFPIGSAVSIAEEYTSIGRHYVTLGDPGASVVQCEDGAPVLFELAGDPSEGPPGERVPVTAVRYTVREYPMGSIGSPFFLEDDDPTYYLTCGPLETVEPPATRVRELLREEAAPLVADGELTWSDELLGDATSE
ncbi:hypothetical protein NGM10_14750 [Halorussus salilacus]|uniref:hypothetical protein n=1 Tax=Halorussus salilacus TaxID=2953750 RepID=UPI00209ECDF7|nr:hypothetical protein [Halorussus salilacus]USZ67980.1 hypothetical protein NGM10_14750 [Halorussus salilacus]